MTEASLGPLVIAPKESLAIWGGDALVKKYGKEGDPNAKVGESWECWDTNAVRTGPLAGQTIAQLRETYGKRLMGTLEPDRMFPVLTKIIDAHANLSVQVHPDDAYAQRVEHQPNGKTECWVILAAEPGAELVLGWKGATTRQEYERRVKDGTLGDILRHVPVKPNDAFYLPSGTLHAIGAGIQLFETQQASDLTYRIFDWNRVGTDGKPRELHVQKAGDVLNYASGTTAATSHLVYSTGGADYETYIADPRFCVERVVARKGEKAELVPDGEPIIIMTLDNAATLKSAAGNAFLPRWTTALIPAELASLELVPSDAVAATLMVTPSRDVFAKRIARAGIAADRRDAFLAQFATAAAAV